ncbi:hypothetical protein FRB95_003886 [Tulasnella sp. JGI-2019a]|nr:hypothetical protein FRB95_003886 [Tulasnella sp. JGI-2019a]
MPRPTLLTPMLTINVPPSGPLRAIISPVPSPMSPSRARRQHNRTRTARPRPLGSFLKVPVEAGAQAGDDSYGDELLTPVLVDRGDARRAKTPTFSVSDDVARDSPQLAEDDVSEIKDFLARKSWIDESIKLYERMPVIDAFVGATELGSGSIQGQPINGLPERDQYEQWVAEQESMEKEMEFFDKGDLNRLKKFAKVKARQNLSSDDTDLVELTLNTLLALEKLTSLIRIRADRLEALRLRLQWEDQRLEAWAHRQSLLGDIETFIRRARWSPSTYDVFTDPADGPSSRATPPHSPAPAYERLRTVSTSSTNASLAASIVIPQSILPSQYTDFSRSHRFNLAESLSREAAGYASRVLNFKASRVTVAANTLEQLIAVSREKVPDEILGAQDHLEVKSSVLDGLGRFAMNIAMQWIKCDQIFGDLKRLQAIALQLKDDVIEAKSQHPLLRHNEAFQSRLSGLNAKITDSATDPTKSRSFPRPLHPAYPDQHASNQYILSVLGLEVQKAKVLTSSASAAAEEYQTLYQAVCHISKLTDDMRSISERLAAATGRLTKGTESIDGDGSPIDITTEACLDPVKHMVYLQSIPTLTWELDDADEAAERAITGCRSTLNDLQEAGVSIDPRLKISAEACVVKLENERALAETVLDEVTARTGFLREARELWTTVQDALRSLAALRQRAVEAANDERWQPLTDVVEDEDDGVLVLLEKSEKENIREKASSSSSSSSPSTSSSASSYSTLEPEPAKLLKRVDEVSNSIANSIFPRQAHLLPALPGRLASHISISSDSLNTEISVLREVVRLLEDIKRQAAIMSEVQDEASALRTRINNIRTSVRTAKHGLSDESEPLDAGDFLLQEETLAARFSRLQEDIRTFVDALPTRVPLFVSTFDPHAPRLLPPVIPNHVKGAAAKALPFSLASLDQDVKSDVNILTSLLTDSLTNIGQQLSNLRVAGYILYTTSFIIPRLILPHIPVRRYLLPVSEGILSTNYYRATATSYIYGVGQVLFGDGGRKELSTFQQVARVQFSVLSQELAIMRRDYELEREERMRSQRELKKEIEGIVDQLRSQQAMTPGRVSTARLDEIASTLANLTAFVQDTESYREESRAIERMRQVSLDAQRTVTFTSKNPFDSP